MSDYLPPEIWVQIFLRVSVKSLLRICSVCKSWYSLISHTYFISMHTHFTITTKPSACYFLRRFSKVLGRELFNLVSVDNSSIVGCQELCCPFKSNLGSFEIIGSCYGLVCLIDSHFNQFTSRKPIILWNPTIGKFMTLALGEDSAHIILGLGFDFKRIDFKLVRIDYNYCEIDVFELGVGVWRSIRNKFPSLIPHFITQMSPPLFFKGAIHWIGYKPIEAANAKVIVIVAFDVSEEEFRVLETPDEIALGGFQVGIVDKLTLSLMGDLLCLIHRVNNVGQVWVMRDYGVVWSWTKPFDICPPGGFLKVLGVWKNGEILLVMHYGEMVSYNLESGRISPLGLYGEPSSFYLDDNYMEVLALWKGQNRVLGSNVAGDRQFNISAGTI